MIDLEHQTELSPSQSAIVDAVRACTGTRFRPQGRVPGLGLDCVGVALLAASAVGLCVPRIGAYALAGDNGNLIEPVLKALGCAPTNTAANGDLLIVAPSPRQRHIAIVTPSGIVHAHAGVGRVVEGPLDPAWALVGAWRFPKAM